MSFQPPEKFFGIPRPCANCPFRTDIPFPLHPARAASIADDLRTGGTFVCHKTVDYSDADVDPGQDSSCMCAGARATAARDGVTSQVEQVASRLGLHVPEMDDNLPVHDSLNAWVASKEDLHDRWASPSV